MAALVDPQLAGTDPTWRHALFLGINAALAVLIVLRPRWLPVLLAVLAAQQLWSHGRALVDAWKLEHRVDWASVVVVVGIPFALAIVVHDARAARRW